MKQARNLALVLVPCIDLTMAALYWLLPDYLPADAADAVIC